VSTGGQNRDTTALLAPDLRLNLPDPASMGRNIEAVQLVSIHHGGNTMVIEAHLSITAARVLLVGIDAAGQRLMTVTWQGTQISVQTSPFLPKEVQPGAMLADIVTLYWPESVVRQVLQAAGATLSVTTSSRVVTLHGRPVLQATYEAGSANPWRGGLRYSNLSWGYDIAVTVLQVTE
jgi:hypothetical protein